MNACPGIVDEGIVRGVLATVDCHTKVYAQAGYLALSGSPVFQGAVTALLTIYVALVGYRLLFAHGATRISDAPLIALRIGAILALVTSWSTFQSLVFDVADRAPVEIAALVTEPFARDDGASLAARPIDGLQAAYNEFSRTAMAYGKLAGPNAKGYSSPQAAAAEATSAASGAIMMVNAGTIAAATLAIGVLTAVGPLFIALALIPATRGLFVGWVRALAAAALTPLVAWLLVVLMLAVLEPWLATLEVQRLSQRLNPQTAMSAATLVFVFAAGQAALVIGACVMAASFRLPSLGGGREGRAPEPARAGQPPAQILAAASRPEQLAQHLQRDQAQAIARARVAQTASAAAASSAVRQLSVSVADAPRLGEAYRRPRLHRPQSGSRKMTRLIAFTAALVLLAGPAGAVTPQPGPGDPRIHFVDYDPQAVVELRVALGYQLAVEFDPAERIENVAIGDSLGWQVTPNKRANLLFLKPMGSRPPTNMTVITTARRYNFELSVRSRSAASTAPFMVRFLYEAPAVAVIASPPPPPPPVERNKAYSYDGSAKNLPVKVFDDGLDTYFAFGPEDDLPAIFAIDADGGEGLVNTRQRDGYVVVDRVVRGFVLRRGEEVTHIYNDGFQVQEASALRERKKNPWWRR